MPLVCFYQCRGCQWSCSPLVQSLITSLAKLSTISFLSIPMCPGTHTSWTLLCSAHFTRDWQQSQINLQINWSCQGPWWLPVRKNIPVLLVQPFPTFSITQALMSYISAWNIAVGSPHGSCAPFSSPIYTPKHQCLYWSWTHPYTRLDPYVVWAKCVLLFTLVRELDHEWLMKRTSQELLSDPICRMGLCSTSQDFLVWPKILSLHCWVLYHLHSYGWYLLLSSQNVHLLVILAPSWKYFVSSSITGSAMCFPTKHIAVNHLYKTLSTVLI